MEGELSSNVLLELTHEQNRRRRIKRTPCAAGFTVKPGIGKNMQRSLKIPERIEETGDAEIALRSTPATSTFSPNGLLDPAPNPNSNPGHTAPGPMRSVSAEFF
jgi:hypothetical protein